MTDPPSSEILWAESQLLLYKGNKSIRFIYWIDDFEELQYLKFSLCEGELSHKEITFCIDLLYYYNIFRHVKAEFVGDLHFPNGDYYFDTINVGMGRFHGMPQYHNLVALGWHRELFFINSPKTINV